MIILEDILSSNLIVDTGCVTTFFVGCLRNKEAVKRFSARPMFEALFAVTYGLDKQKLERINKIVRAFAKSYDENVRTPGEFGRAALILTRRQCRSMISIFKNT
jgi:hypothetical protein